jgi:prepilin-type N-terminal cleavage/methylation domain-containing protein
MRFCNKQSGFTLIELIVIIAIVGVFAAIAVPNLNCDVAVTFASGNPEYEIWTDSDNDDIEDSGEVITKNIQSNYHDVTIDTDRNIKFSPRGTASSYGIIALSLPNSAGSKDVKVHITGRVKIE